MTTGEDRPAEDEGDEGVSACFVDTNVLVFAAALRAPLHRRAFEEIRRRRQSGQELWISRQILREYLAVRSRPQTYSSPRPVRELVTDVRVFQRQFRVAEEGRAVTEKLLELIEGKETRGKQIHDANVVATMLVHGIPNLLTHNEDDFSRFAELIRVIPLEEGEN